jgi:DNA-binding MarR family transcriptional regulator
MSVNQSLPPPASRPDRGSDDRLFLREEELLAGVNLVLAAARALQGRLRASAAASGLSESQCDILLAIHAEPGLDVATLRARLGLPTPTLARLLARLDQDGWIDRSARSRKDARRAALALTPEGASLAASLLAPLTLPLRAAYREAGAADVAGARRLLSAMTREATRTTPPRTERP